MTENSGKRPGYPKNTTLGERMKEYESVSDHVLLPGCPIYARIDGRSFHTFCRGLGRPFDVNFTSTMQETCKHIVENTNAVVGYVQSDEMSFGWEDSTKIPFGNRLSKLQSVLAGMATSAFVINGMNTNLKDRITGLFPHFDCRVLNLPSIEELSNMFLWRELDCMKNSVTMVASSVFSDKELFKKNSTEKIEMLKERGVDYERDYDETMRMGTYFRREKYTKILTEEELKKIPESQITRDVNGNCTVVRSHVVKFSLGYPLHTIANKAKALFYGEEPTLR